MKAIRIQKFGDPNVLELCDIEDVTPQSKEICVSIRAIGVNPVDTYIRAGTFYKPTLPFTPGFDASGIIADVGADVRSVKKGDRVYCAGTISGAYAQQMLCRESQVYGLPERISFEQGAALGIPYATAYYGLFYKAHAVAGETVLVHGASGGVGIAAIQLAKAADLTVIATAGSQEGQELVAAQRADHVLNHAREEHFSEIEKITDGMGVDVILEMLANVNLPDDLKVIARRGRIVVVGCRDIATISPRDMMAKESSIIGLTIMNATPEETVTIHGELIKGIEGGSLSPVIRETLPLADAARAHVMVLEPGAHGKIILIPPQTNAE